MNNPAICAAILLTIAGCSAEPAVDPNETIVPEQDPPDIASIIALHQDSVMQAGVTGMGESRCDGKPCIRIYLEKDDPALTSSLPEELDGVPVVIEVSGQFEAR
ncbi:MAG: hypothetical protein P8Y61_10495 [Gammaproteobacteria bacterium]|jgi:hypothetical protein